MALKYIRFILSRGVGTLVDTLILWLLSKYIFSSYTGVFIIAPAISFEFAVFSNFIFSYYWIWSKRITNKSTVSFFKHFIMFNLSSVIGFLIKMGFLLLLGKIFKWNVVICNLVALCFSGIANFFLNEMVVFKKSPIINKIMEYNKTI